MNTKEALELAVNVLEKEKTNTEYSKAIKLLRQLQRRDLVAKWTQDSIIAALDKWKDKNGIPPNVTSLTEPGMPGASIIQKHFGMGASAFLHRRYPNYDLIPPKNQYGYKSEDDWINCFREQFLKHCHEEGFSSKTYNMLKDKDTPIWSTIASHCGTTKWSKLMELAGVKYPGKPKQYERGKLRITVVKSPWLERFEAAVAERRILDQRLIEVIQRNSERKK